jgi:glycosyltransferase involved in cell wall biosynthesis
MAYERAEMRIAFVGPEFIPWRPIDFTNLWDSPRCLTGTESSIVIFARELVKLGHQVSIYYNESASAFDGVTVADVRKLVSDAPGFDVVCLWNVDPKCLSGVPHGVARVFYTTGNRFDFAHNFEDEIDLFLSPSEDHCAHMKKWTLTHTNKWRVLPLGCYLDDYGIVEKIPGRVIHTSSPDRGLHWVLQEWPSIRKSVPDATLRIFYYGIDDYVRGANPESTEGGTSEHGHRGRYIGAALDRLKLDGVDVFGSSSRNVMRRELSEAMVLAYPCDPIAYSEGFSVSIMEGCASGALPVIVGADALISIYKGHVPCVDPPARKAVGQWRDLVIRSLTDSKWQKSWVTRARALAERHDYIDLARRMEGLFEQSIALKRSSPAVATQSRIKLDVLLSRFAMGEAAAADPERYVEVSHGGGSLIGCLHLVHALRRRGDYDVRMFAHFCRSMDGFCELSDFNPEESRDAVMAFYDTSPLAGINNGCLRIASHHTYMPSQGFPDYADINTAPTPHTVDHLRRCYDPHGTWYVLPNGVQDPGVTWRPVPGRLLHHASADRGLHLLFLAWPKIISAVPGARLRVVGVPHVVAWNEAPLFPSFARTSTGKRIMAMRAAIKVANAAGSVDFLGHVPRDVLIQELSSASCFAYPCSVKGPCESFSVSTMECLLAGVPVVLSPSDALSDLYRNVVSMTPCPAEDHLDEFSEAVIEMLRSPRRQNLAHSIGLGFAARYTHDREAVVLDQIIRRHLP